MQKLTSEQAKLVEENHNLIYSYAHTHKLDLEEWYGVLALALCYAASTFTPDKSNLSTWYYVVAGHRVACAYRDKQAKKRIPKSLTVSLSDESNKYENLTLADCIMDNTINLAVALEFKEAFSEISGVDKEIVIMRLCGLTQQKIAENLGVSPSAISRRLQVIKDKLKQ